MRVRVTTHQIREERILRGDLHANGQMGDVEFTFHVPPHRVNMRLSIVDTEYLINILTAALQEAGDVQDARQRRYKNNERSDED